MQKTANMRGSFSPKKTVSPKYQTQQAVELIDGEPVSHSSITRIERALRDLKKEYKVKSMSHMIKQEDQSYDIEKAKAAKNEMELIKDKINAYEELLLKIKLKLT